MTSKQGTISRLRNGRYWARAPLIDGKQKPLGTFATEQEAREHLACYVAMHGTVDDVSNDERTLSRFGASVLDLREQEGVRGIRKERGVFRVHLADCELAKMPITEITSKHVVALMRKLMLKDAKDKRGRRKVSRRTVQRCLTLLSAIFNEAVLRELIDVNPCVGVPIRKRANEGTEETWTFLTPDEQARLLSCEEIPRHDRLMIAFAMYTGIRQGEFCHNGLRDLHLDDPAPTLFVRYGSKGKPPKNGKTRKVEILPGAFVAIREWLQLRPTFTRSKKRWEVRKDDGVIFPTITGARRASGKPLGNGWHDPTHPRATDNGWVDRFAHYCHLAGIEDRPGLHWHCLRHTCATSLVEGFWDDDPWALEEVRDMLGHSSIVVTQRYAHSSGKRLRDAANRMRASYALVMGNGGAGSSEAAISNDSAEAPPTRLERVTFALGKRDRLLEDYGVGAPEPPLEKPCS